VSLQSISPERAKQLIDNGAVLIDIREPDEHAREHIPQAQLRPISCKRASSRPDLRRKSYFIANRAIVR
jgi:rhodanese-related sulfurtransferase